MNVNEEESSGSKEFGCRRKSGKQSTGSSKVRIEALKLFNGEIVVRFPKEANETVLKIVSSES